MALGFGSKKSDSSPSPSPPTEKPYGDYAPDQPTAEHGSRRFKKGKHPMNRIDKPITKSITGDALADDSTDASVSIG